MNGPRVLRRGGGTAWFLAPRNLKNGLALLGLSAACLMAGCKSSEPTTLSDEEKQPFIASVAKPGDVLRISFPGAPNLSTVQPVQPNGIISLPLGGNLEVRDKTAAELEKALLELYGPQLVIKEVTVSLESAGFPVFVSGAVLRPGRLQCTRPMTAFEVLAESGGFIEGRADLKRVKVVRLEKDGTTRTIILDLKSALAGKASEPFYVRPSDVIHVPEKFSFY